MRHPSYDAIFCQETDFEPDGLRRVLRYFSHSMHQGIIRSFRCFSTFPMLEETHYGSGDWVEEALQRFLRGEIKSRSAWHLPPVISPPRYSAILRYFLFRLIVSNFHLKLEFTFLSRKKKLNYLRDRANTIK